MEKRIVLTTPGSISLPMSASPCSVNEVTASSGDCVEGGVEQFLENEALPGFRVWQLAGIVLSVLLTFIIALCCCLRFRVPRTKQEIEADYIRKKITRSFRKELTKINNEEMDEMDLKQGGDYYQVKTNRTLDRVRAKFDAETELQKQQKEATYDEAPRGFKARINAIIHGVHLRLAPNEPRELNGVI